MTLSGRRRSPIPPPPPDDCDQDFSSEPSVVTHMLDQLDDRLAGSIDQMERTERKADQLERVVTRGSVPSIQEALRREAERDPVLAAALAKIKMKRSRPPEGSA